MHSLRVSTLYARVDSDSGRHGDKGRASEEAREMLIVDNNQICARIITQSASKPRTSSPA